MGDRRTVRGRRLLLTAFVILATPAMPQWAFGAASDDEALVRTIDGDTLSIGQRRIRLHGIDAPESAQNCQAHDGVLWNCGSKATAVLASLIIAGVECVSLTVDRFGREVARCTNAQGEDVGAEMVRLGWAVAFIRYSRDYEELEVQAREGRLGLWAGLFERPEEYRRQSAKK